jgi:hypothetical protein
MKSGQHRLAAGKADVIQRLIVEPCVAPKFDQYICGIESGHRITPKPGCGLVNAPER